MAAAMQKLHDDFLSCNICTELYQDPCTLACGHTFCRRCLATFTKTQRDAIKAKYFLCPNCRQMTKVPNPGRSVDDWVKQIKPSFLIVGLLDSFASQSESDKVSENFCFSCKQSGEKTPASSHCIDCGISICTRCTKGHKAMPGTSHHVITDLGEGVTVKRKRKVICKAHNSIIEFCCKDCHKAVCQKCCILDHRNCDNVVTIESMVPEMKSVLRKKNQMMTEEVNRKTSVFTQKENKIKDITERRADIQIEMSNVVEKAIRLIKQKYKQLEGELAMLTEKIPEMKSVLQEKKQMMTLEVKTKKASFTQKENKIKENKAQQAEIQAKMSEVTQKVISLVKQKLKLLEDQLAMLTQKEISGMKAHMKSEEIDIQTYQQHLEFIDQVLAAESEMDMYDMYQMCQSGAITTLSDNGVHRQHVPPTRRIVFVEGQT